MMPPSAGCLLQPRVCLLERCCFPCKRVARRRFLSWCCCWQLGLGSEQGGPGGCRLSALHEQGLLYDEGVKMHARGEMCML